MEQHCFLVPGIPSTADCLIQYQSVLSVPVPVPILPIEYRSPPHNITKTLYIVFF